MKKHGIILPCALLIILLAGCTQFPAGDNQQNGPAGTEEQQTKKLDLDYVVVSTGQNKCYDDSGEITCPEPGEPFFGQNAQFPGVKFSYEDNDNGTVTDLNTGLMWQKSPDLDNKSTLDEAAAGADKLDLAGHDDWRLPNAKELQSIGDYDRAPDAANAARRGPAIDTSFFEITEDESYFWTNTTLLEAPPQEGAGSQAGYIAFGQAFGFMGGSTDRTNVHGAGSQRSDPKSGDPADFAGG